MTGDAHARPQPAADAPLSAPVVVPPSGHSNETILEHPLDADSLYQLRASVAAHAARAGLPRRRAEDLVIAAHELAANVVRHGSGKGRLRIWRHDEMLHCQVSDDGQHQRIDSTVRNAADPSSWPIAPGHGLWLVRQLADSFSLHPGQRGGAGATISFALSPSVAVRPFTLSEHDRCGSTTLLIAGQLDLNSADKLTGAIRQLLEKDPAAKIVIDLAGLTFWDAFGLAGLLRAQNRVDTSHGASMVLAGLPSQLASHLRETGLAERFHIPVDQQPG